MTALAAARPTPSKGNLVRRRYAMVASTTIYAGSLVMLNSAGLALPAAALASNKGCVGIAESSVTSGASGTTYIYVLEGVFSFAGTTLARADTRSVVYAEDDQTVDETQGTNEPRAGLLVEYVSASEAWIEVSAKIAAL